MVVQDAEERFQEGMRLLADGRAKDALPFIAAAVEAYQQKEGAGRGQAKYLSYYGLCLSRCGTRMREALRCCRVAAEREEYIPSIWWNLGRVALVLGRRSEAHRALLRGIRLQPGNKQILRELRRMGVRRRPPVPFLGRGNPVNVLLGRLRGTGMRA